MVEDDKEEDDEDEDEDEDDDDEDEERGTRRVEEPVCTPCFLSHSSIAYYPSCFSPKVGQTLPNTGSSCKDSKKIPQKHKIHSTIR